MKLSEKELWAACFCFYELGATALEISKILDVNCDTILRHVRNSCPEGIDKDSPLFDTWQHRSRPFVRWSYKEYVQPVVGYEYRYRITAEGEMFSNTYTSWRKMHPAKSGHGYWYIPLRNEQGVKKNRYIHHMILEAFHGPRPDNYQASHLSGNRDINTALTLVWESVAANMSRQAEHGTKRTGEAISNKLKNTDVLSIRKLYEVDNMTVTQLANMFGVALATISNIVHRKTWKQLKKEK